MLTEKDIDEIELRLKEAFTTKEEFEKYRSELMDKLDSILKEVIVSRQEETIISHRVSDHEDRITTLEVAKTN